MVDARIGELFERQARIFREQRKEPFAGKVIAKLNEFNARNVLRSSMWVQAAAGLYKSEYADICGGLWQRLHRIAMTIGVEPDEELPEHLRGLFDGVAVPIGDEFLQEFSSAKTLNFDARIAELCIAEIAAAAETSREVVAADIDLFAHSADLGQRASAGASIVFNNFAPVGVQQTGDLATAEVTQSINTEGMEALLTALQNLQKEIIESHPDRADIVGLIDVASAEIESTTPDVGKLSGLLQGLGSVVPTLDRLPAAYGALKGAASLIGVGLP